MGNKVSYIIQLKNKFSGPARQIDKQFLAMEQSAGRLNRRLEQQKKKFKNLGDFGKRTAAQGAVATAAITAPILLLSRSMVNAASDSVEVANKFNEVFDTVENKANQVATSFAKNFGVAGSTARQMIGDTGDLLVGFGFSGDAALEMSSKVAELASDLTSFQNFAGGAGAANVALTKALLGESESAKALGIVVRQGTNEFKDNVAAIMESQRVNLLQAKAIEILRIATSQSKKAVGDVSRTWGDHSSVVRRNSEEVKKLKESFGRLLLPMATKVTRAMTALAQWLEKLSPAWKTVIIAAAGFLAVGGPLLILLGGIAFAVSAISAPVLLVGAAILGLGAIITAVALNWDSLMDFMASGLLSFVNLAVWNLNALLKPFNFIAEKLGFDGVEIPEIKIARTMMVEQPAALQMMVEQPAALQMMNSRSAPTTPAGGSESTLNGMITVAAEKGAVIKQAVLSTAGNGLNIGMNVPAGAQ